MTNATTASSSRPKQRTRKGKERDVSLEPTATPAQVEDVPQESRTRRRGNNKTHAKKRVSPVTHTAQPVVDPQPHPTQPSKGPRPRARPLNKDGAQTSLNPTSQNDSQVQLAVPERAASDAIGSPNPMPSETRDTTNDSSGAAPQLARKRLHTASRDELNSGNKKRKIRDQRRAKATKEQSSSLGADIVTKGNDT